MHFGGANRSGWLVPNELGEELVPEIATPLSGMRAYLLRDHRDRNGNGIVDPDFLASPIIADLAEHVQHMAALDIGLEREDGTPLPTTCIGIQNVEELGALGRKALARWEAEQEKESWQRDDDFSLEELEETDLSDPGPFEIIIADTGEATAWEPDEDCAVPATERYQIHVNLVDGNDVPGEALLL